MTSKTRTTTPEATRALAAALGRAVPPEGLVVALVGPLGAGKTVFAKGLAEGLGLDPAGVASPTFVIASEYPLSPAQGRPRRLAHVDLYRVESARELEAVGFDDLLAPGVVLVVEWADRFPAALPPDHLELRFEAAGAEVRILHWIAYGPVGEATLSRLQLPTATCP